MSENKLEQWIKQRKYLGLLSLSYINCKTCYWYKDCVDEEFCLNSKKFLLWSPKDRNFCLDCPMSYDNGKGCTRHAEPCFKHPFYSDMSKWDAFLKEYEERIKNL